MNRPLGETNRFDNPSVFTRFVAAIISVITTPVAWCISRVKINRISFSRSDSVGEDALKDEVILKQRSVLSRPLIFAGNTVFRFRRVPVRVLGFKEWVQWEQQIQKATEQKQCVLTSAGLQMFRIPGVPLSEVLQSSSQSEDRVLELLTRALAALHRLHQTEVKLDGQTFLLSHGDASATNLLFDESSDSLNWFDFDLRHDLNINASLRHADDLRALLFTAYKCLPSEVSATLSFQQLADQIRLAYPEARVWESMQNIVNSRWFAFDLFHHAQLLRIK